MSVLGTIVSDFKKGAEDVKNFLIKVADDAPAVVTKVVTDGEKVAAVVEQFVPGSTTVIAMANTLLDTVAQEVEDIGAAASANGLSVQLDAKIVADMQAIIAAAKKTSSAL